ncbi:hypothetical protein NQ318_022586 [Aromia moschata]|uniref:HAT C-terminal dimerisation domain-containing protein n=1 Tax=Aromia moschata TaxID=1265417 RepID=A0AAV8XXL0_9CUCU|nr:hypothetical protein NQ318_022586 [Aromia moschata]
MKTNNDSRIKESLKNIALKFLGQTEDNTFPSEYKIWQNNWESMAEKTSTALETLDHCENQLFPAIKLLTILATLPVSTATPEKCLSTLKRLKNDLRNSMGDERLTGLALMSVHRDIAVQLDSDEIMLAIRQV